MFCLKRLVSPLDIKLITSLIFDDFFPKVAGFLGVCCEHPVVHLTDFYFFFFPGISISVRPS